MNLAAASAKAYQLLAHGQWFSSGTPAYTTTRTGRHDIAEILLKVYIRQDRLLSVIINWIADLCSLTNKLISFYQTELILVN